ncbi:hypothetical protein OG760_29615 [Streptomyces sp. NBC_00963]|uniref:hypothetical protein n=1 Tax=Streptomyces sp. NBC_00963 TaxID=2903697 RepID=UPI003868BD3C|nr:hypothetical protein OG760_29615 [Streptomyces sp. NBC_00963]
MNRVRTFALFWYDFVVGDDWRIAVGVALALAATAGLVHIGINAWWLLPITAVTLLGLSLHRAAHSTRR